MSTDGKYEQEQWQGLLPIYHDGDVFVSLSMYTAASWTLLPGKEGSYEIIVAKGQDFAGMKLTVGVGQKYRRDNDSTYLTLVSADKQGSLWKTGDYPKF